MELSCSCLPKSMTMTLTASIQTVPQITIEYRSSILGPRITAQTPSGMTTGYVSYVEVTFSEAISASTFMPEDVVLTKSGQSTGAVPTIASVNGNTYRISFIPPLFHSRKLHAGNWPEYNRIRPGT